MKKLVDVGNAHACYNLAGYYATGDHGTPQDVTKANELYLRAGELGRAEGYCNLGFSYDKGRGMEMDKKKARHFYELAAMNGDAAARFNIGLLEGKAGNVNRAVKHFILSARAGKKDSLDKVKTGFMHGIVTKDEYANTLRAYQKIQDDMKSDDRDKAAIYQRSGV